MESQEELDLPAQKLAILPPKLAQRLAKKKITEEIVNEHPLSLPSETESRLAGSTNGKTISSGPKIRAPDKEMRPAVPQSQQPVAVPVEHPREWVSNMQGNKKHSSRRFSPGRDPAMDCSSDSLTIPHRAASAPTPVSRPLIETQPRANPSSSAKPKVPLTSPKRNRSSPERTGRQRAQPQQRSPPSAAGTGRSPSEDRRRFVSPNPKVSSKRSERHFTDSLSRHRARVFGEEQEEDPATLSDSILRTNDHQTRDHRPKLSNQWTPINKLSHQRSREDRQRKTRSISPRKVPPAMASQNRSASVDFRSNPWGDRIRAQLTQVPPAPPSSTASVQLEGVRNQIDDYLAETVKRGISPERLGKTNIKYLDLKSMESLLKGLPPSINSLLNTPQLSDPLKDSTKRRSSPGANHRRDVLTDAAEWSRLLDWLDSIGMSRHSNCFRQGGVTKLSIVELLGPHDLIQMGIHRPDAVKMIYSIQEISRRTKFLTEEAMSTPPTQPKRRMAESGPVRVPTAPPARHSLEAALPSTLTPDMEGKLTMGMPLVTFKPPSVLQRFSSGLVSVPLLLQFFDRGDLSQLLELWCRITSHIKSLTPRSPQILQPMTMVDFYLRLHIAITPHRSGHSHSQSSEAMDRMEEFKRYLEACYQSEDPEIITLVSSRLYAAYAGVVMVPQPLHNPAYAALFDMKWIRALRVRLIRFLEGIRSLRINPSLSSARDSEASGKHVSSEVSPITSTDLSDHPLSNAAPDESDSCLSVSQLPAPPPPEPPNPPPASAGLRPRSSPSIPNSLQKEPVLQRQKKTKPIKVRKITAVLGSGPLVIEEVQEEVTDDEDEEEHKDKHPLSPLQTIKHLGTASFVPIPFSLRTQTTLLDEIAQAKSPSSAPPSSLGTPALAVDINIEAEDYDFSQIHRPIPEPPEVAVLSREEELITTESAHIPQEEGQEEELANDASAMHYSGYYDEEGNWRYHNYDHGYYDPLGVWHDAAAEGVVERELVPEGSGFEEAGQNYGEAEAIADSEQISITDFTPLLPIEDKANGDNDLTQIDASLPVDTPAEQDPDPPSAESLL